MAVFANPETFVVSAFHPTAVFLEPPEFVTKALAPTAVLVDTAPAPRPTRTPKTETSALLKVVVPFTVTVSPTASPSVVLPVTFNDVTVPPTVDAACHVEPL